MNNLIDPAVVARKQIEWIKDVLYPKRIIFHDQQEELDKLWSLFFAFEFHEFYFELQFKDALGSIDSESLFECKIWSEIFKSWKKADLESDSYSKMRDTARTFIIFKQFNILNKLFSKKRAAEIFDVLSEISSTFLKMWLINKQQKPSNTVDSTEAVKYLMSIVKKEMKKARIANKTISPTLLKDLENILLNKQKAYFDFNLFSKKIIKNSEWEETIQKNLSNQSDKFVKVNFNLLEKSSKNLIDADNALFEKAKMEFITTSLELNEILKKIFKKNKVAKVLEKLNLIGEVFVDVVPIEDPCIHDNIQDLKFLNERWFEDHQPKISLMG